MYGFIFQRHCVNLKVAARLRKIPRCVYNRANDGEERILSEIVAVRLTSFSMTSCLARLRLKSSAVSKPTYSFVAHFVRSSIFSCHPLEHIATPPCSTFDDHKVRYLLCAWVWDYKMYCTVE